MPQILEKSSLKHPCLVTPNIFKKHTKSFVFKIQNSGDPNEWEGANTPLHNVPGLPRAKRENIPKASYIEI